jgi:hypothetical protein
LLSIACFRVPAQQPLSEEQKKRLFLKAREEMTTIPYTPPKPDTAPKPKPRTTIEPTPKPVAPKPPTPPIPSTPPAVKPPPPKEISRPPQPAPTPRANIVIRDSGVSKADDDDSPPPKDESVWSRLFGSGGGNYKYLTPSVRRAIDRAPVTRGRWRNIVVHNSGTRQGNAAAFEHYHRYVRKMPNGMAYHFVIGNGTSSKNGAIEIGSRWHRQVQGGHVHSDYLNNISVGICLVGDFNRDEPTLAQREALEELIRYIRRRVGRVGGQQAVVWAHRGINPPRWPTDCPGNKFPFSWLERKF